MPAAPVLALIKDSGASASDGWTNDGSIRVDALEQGASWQFSLDGGITWWNGTGAILASRELGADGLKEVRVRQTDAAGHLGLEARVDFRLDTRAEAIDLSLANDTGTSPSDGLTRDASIAVNGLEPGASWEYRINGGAWLPGTGMRIDAAAFAQEADGAQRVEVLQTDGAGNQSSAALSLNLDREVAGLSAWLSNDTGTKGDLITRDASVIVSGFQASATWSYRIDGGAWTIGTGDRIAAAAFGADGLHKLDLRQADAAGNETATAFEFTLDRAGQVPTLALTRDTGISATDGLTSDATVAVTDLERGATWEYSFDGLSWQAGSGSSIPTTAFGADGAKRVLVRQTDGAGNQGLAAELKFTLDTVAPLPDATLHSLARDKFPMVSTAGADAVFHTGSAVNHQTWMTVKLDANAVAWAYSLDGGTSFQGGGTDGRIDLATLGGEGTHEVRIRQQDAAGNWSADKAFNLTVDLTAPTAVGQYAPAQRDASGRVVQTQGFGFNSNEDTQLLFVPLDTPNDGTAQSFLQSWHARGLLVEAGKETFRPWWRDPDAGPYVVVAVDKAGNASFATMKGSTGATTHEVHTVVLDISGAFQDNRIVDAQPEQAGGTPIARAGAASDHLYGTQAADRFVFGSFGGIDWIHGYDRGQGDVIELSTLQVNVSSAADIARFLRKDFLADGTISLWVDLDGRGQTAPDNYDLRVLIGATGGTDLVLKNSYGNTFVL